MNRQEHLLTCLAEECAEVAQRVSKALRFGLLEIQPGQPLTNQERINEEIYDLLSVIDILEGHGILLDLDYDADRFTRKQAKIEKFMAYAAEQGALS